jgi:hypothetical protein
MNRVFPPPSILEVAVAVQVVTPRAAVAVASKVNTMLSPGAIDAPPVLVRLIVVADKL